MYVNFSEFLQNQHQHPVHTFFNNRFSITDKIFQSVLLGLTVHSI